MALVTLADIGMSYGAYTILNRINVEIFNGNRIGLIGNNGTGKSTLLRIIAGIEIATDGKVERQHGLRIAYLPQEPQLARDASVFDEALDAFSPLLQLETELYAVEKILEETPHPNQALERHRRLLDRYESEGGYKYRAEARSVLSALGFNADEWDKPVSVLSGGEKARVSLARTILERPDLLMLDEPTNHLDFAALDWLENYLSKWRGTLIVSTHDRLLLSKVPDRIWLLEDGSLKSYRGNYQAHLKVYTLEQEVLQKRHKEQQAFVARTEEFIRRNKVGQKHAQAKDREKKLQRMEVIEAPRESRHISFNFDPGPRCSDPVLKTKGLIVGFAAGEDDHNDMLFACPDLTLTKGERVALVGPNGCGKSTFLKVLLGETMPLVGELRYGHNVQIGYLPQDKESQFDKDTTVLQAVLSSTNLKDEEVRSFLGRFLFTKDEVFKKLGELSGGQLSRVALARVSQVKGNLLLLDEPTNHLDIESREVLQKALRAYAGTVIIVSHDRYLIDALATAIWEIREGNLFVYRGNYTYYQERRQQETDFKQELHSAEATNKPRKPVKAILPAKRETPHSIPNSVEARLVEQISFLEQEVANLEVALAEASYGPEHKRIAELNAQYKLKSSELQDLMERWSSLSLSASEPQS
jgi:ATP-binding cassette subfamily F protein 3